MNEWKSPIVEKPPQGMKVLCFDKGDLYVAQRFLDYWFSIPFTDSRLAYKDPPQMWQYINFPEPFKGKMFVMPHDDIMMDIDELEKNHPEILNSLIDSFLKDFRSAKK